MFTKKYSNALMDTNEPSAEISEKYKAAIQHIERLEHQINQQVHDFNLLRNANSILNDGMKCCSVSLADIHEKLLAMVAQVDQTNNSDFELRQVNSALKSSGDEWFKRAIKLEFDILTLKDELKKIQHERDLALKMCEQLQIGLMSTHKKNSRGRTDL
jgi:predicted nuclease with TOPRIM domain